MEAVVRREQCAHCPFRTDGNGLRRGRERWLEIRVRLLRGQYHPCHTDDNLSPHPHKEDAPVACRGGHSFQMEQWLIQGIPFHPTEEELQRVSLQPAYALYGAD